MSSCCFNQVESGLCTDLQLVERLLLHMGFIMGLGGNQSGTIVFPLLLQFSLSMSVDTHNPKSDLNACLEKSLFYKY